MRTLFCLFLSLFAGSPILVAGRDPNLIVIMADDLGYADVGFNGSEEIPTPNIDRIANEGIRFSSGYVTYPVCGPSRAGFMTGRYPQRFGFERNPQYQTDDPNMGLPLTEQTIADVLKPVGYTSGIVGKWHLGAHPDLHPLERGFDYFFGHLGGGHRYFPEDLTIRDSYDAEDESDSYRTWILRNHEPVRTTKYLTDEFSDAAVRFIQDNHDSPFFLFLSYNAPHAPMQAPEEYLSRFTHIADKKRRTYAAMVSALDDGVGRVLYLLDEYGLAEDTLVFFLSDNGGPTRANASLNAPLRGFKSDVWEGGYRVPFALRWTGQIQGGRDFDLPVSALDILATIADLAGAPISPGGNLDGVNLVPYLQGDHEGAPHDHIYIRKWDQKRYAIREGNLKLVIPGEGKAPLLYDLAADIGETVDLSPASPRTIVEMETSLRHWEAGLIEPRFLGLIHTERWRSRQANPENSEN